MFCFDIDILCLQLNQLSNQNKMPHEFLYCWVSISISVAKKKHFFCLWHSGKKLLQHSWNGIVLSILRCFCTFGIITSNDLNLHLNQCVKNNQWQKERHEEVNCKYHRQMKGEQRERDRERECRVQKEIWVSEGAFNQPSTSLQPTVQDLLTNRTQLLRWNKSTANKRKTSNWAPIIVENRPLFMPDVKIGRIATFVEGRSYPDLI